MRYKPFWLALVLVVALVPLPAGASQQEPPPPGLDALSAPSDLDAEDIAIGFVQAEAATYGVAASDVQELAVLSRYVSKHNGVTHVNLAQQYDGLDIFGAAATVNLLSDGSVLFVGESLVNGLKVASDELAVDAAAAVAGAASGLGLAAPAGLRVLEDGDEELTLSGGGISDAPIEAKLGWQATSTGLRLAWQLVIDDSTDVHLWNATVDAATGSLLAADDWTSSHSMTDLAHLARGSSAYSASFVFPGSSNPVNDGSSYRVYAEPRESPNDGDRVVVHNPADAAASPYGWHDTNGVAGPEFTITRGNNVHAYGDSDANNTPDFGGNPDGGAGLDFDNPVDLNEHSQNYRDAVITNLFYINNYIHDVLYLLGFDEPADNFQAINYGGGGNGDYVRAEAYDGGGTNNANFSTPSAGGTPRMQMYLWPGTQFGSPNQLAGVTGVGDINAGWTRYGPSPTVAGVAGQLVYVANGCVAGDYPAVPPVGTWIAVADGGTGPCAYLVRSNAAQAAGASGLIIAHNAAGAAPTLTGSLAAAAPTIPTVAITQADGVLVKAAIAGGTTTGTLRKHPSHPGIRDGDFENGIIIHEYGHGISNRLTGGPGINCLSGNEQMGEGWSDYYALTMLADPTLDDPNGPRGMGPYALFQPDRGGNGIRPRPYSRNTDIQPFTYDMIKTNGWITGGSLAVPHGIGHAWAATLWDMTWNLIDAHGFNPDIYQPWNTGGNILSLQLVTDGLKIQGCGPGFVVGRAAIIAADVALTGGENHCLLWRTFAKRGLGVSAIQGTTNRDDNTQAFDIPDECVKNQARVNLTGGHVPSANYVMNAGDPNATAGVRVSWNQSGQVCLSHFQLTGLTAGSITSVKIHSGGHGLTGPEIVNFNIPPNGLPNSCVGGVSQATLLDMRKNPSRYYINVTTAAYPNGALRDQLG